MPRLLRIAAALAVFVMIVAVSPDSAVDVAGFTSERPSEHHTRWSVTPDDGRPAKAPNPWFFIERAWPQMEIPRDAWRQAQLDARAMAAGKRDVLPVWVLEGPTNIGGRITSLVVDPRNEDVVYAGAAEGGVIRSRDGGQSWQPVFDFEASLAIGALALDPMIPDVVYAGTGEVNPGGGSVAYGGTGLYRSVDQGDSWQPLGLEDVGAIGRIVIDPTDRQRIFVAAMGHLWSPGPERGVYRTEDGGVTWETVQAAGNLEGLSGDDKPHFRSLHFVDENHGWIAGYRTEFPELEQYHYAVMVHTSDGGQTWEKQMEGVPVRLRAVRFADAQRGWAVGYDIHAGTSTVFATEDGGKNWIAQKTVFGEEFMAIFERNGHVWIAGDRVRTEPQKLLRLVPVAGDVE